VDDDSGTRPGDDGHEAPGPEAHTADSNRDQASPDTPGRRTGDSGEPRSHDTTNARPHGTDKHPGQDTQDHRTDPTGTHDDPDTPGRRTHRSRVPRRQDTADGRRTRGGDGHDGPESARRAPHGVDNPASPGPAGTVDPSAGARLEHRWEQRSEIPLAVASLAFLGSYAVRVLAPGLPEPALDLCLAVTLGAWALFAADYAVRWRLSGRRLGFVRTHLLDTVVLILPLLRPLRVVKLYEAVQRRHGRPRLALHARVIVYAGMSTLLLGFTGALAVYQQERDAPDATMRTFGDAVWWTCATLSTVGYGDVVPVTPLGRLIAVGVMAIGLALLAAVTGTFASWLLQVFAREDD
jgi:voltage-gated potassium channel